MKLTELQKIDITDKNQRLNDIKPILKTEFIGIDGVIDDVIEAIRPFYIFPKSLKRPLVVNLWGMTATGKTHLVERIVELLHLKNKFVRFDVGEYTGNDYKLRSDLSDEVSKLNGKDLIITFDEFQFGRTIDEFGKEIPSNSMRPVWDLLDSGKIYKWDSNSNRQSMFDFIKILEECNKHKFEIVDGIVMDKTKDYNRIFRNYSFVPFDFQLVDAVGIGEYSRIPEEFIQKKNSNYTPTNKEKRKNKKNTTSQSKDDNPKEFWYSPYAILQSDVDLYDSKPFITNLFSSSFLKYFKNPYLIKTIHLRSFFFHESKSF